MSRELVVAQLVSVFRQYGYEGASLSKISEATGLGKASLYHYFPRGKEEMAKAVLAHLQAWRETHVLAKLRADQPPRERLQAMTEALQQVYAEGRQSCLLSVLSMGEARATFAPQIQPALCELIAAIAGVLQEAGLSADAAQERAEDAVMQIQGALVLARALDNNQPFLRLMARLPEQLLAP